MKVAEKFWTFFNFFTIQQKSRSLRTSIFPQIAPVGDFFWTFLQIFFRPVIVSKQVSFQKSSHWGNLFELFCKKLSLPSLIHLCLHQVSSKKIWKSSDFFWLFLIFLSGSLSFSRIVPNKYLSKNSSNGSDFFVISQKISSFQTSIFPKKPLMVQIFLNFFLFSFQQHGCVEKASRKTKNNII